MPAMKFVVAGTPGVMRRSASRSAAHSASSASLQNRRKSSSCPGLLVVVVARGGRICAQAVYRCDQNAVPHVSLSVARSPCRARNQSRNAAADTSQ
jgi:hypothetical protein